MTTFRPSFPAASILVLVAALALGCGGDDTVCEDDRCACTTSDPCTHACEEGVAQCHVQGGQGPVDVTCDQNAECHVECSNSASCMVECGGSADCNVTCPASGCTVTGCVGDACDVTCGLFGVATRTGTTATCP